MIEVKLSTIINSIEVLQKISNSPIKGRTAYKVGKLLKRIEEEFDLFNDSRKKLIDQYALKDKEGDPITEDGSYKISPDKISEFNAEVSGLLDTVVKIDLDPIPIEEIENIEFTPNEIILIDDFIEG